MLIQAVQHEGRDEADLVHEEHTDPRPQILQGSQLRPSGQGGVASLAVALVHDRQEAALVQGHAVDVPGRHARRRRNHGSLAACARPRAPRRTCRPPGPWSRMRRRCKLALSFVCGWSVTARMMYSMACRCRVVSGVGSVACRRLKASSPPSMGAKKLVAGPVGTVSGARKSMSAPCRSLRASMMCRASR